MSIFGDIIGWFTNIGKDAASTVADFFKGLAGQIAAALEAGFLAIFKDVWDVIVGPVEIFVGGIIVMVALFVTFSSDLTNIAGIVGTL